MNALASCDIPQVKVNGVMTATLRVVDVATGLAFAADAHDSFSIVPPKNPGYVPLFGHDFADQPLVTCEALVGHVRLPDRIPRSIDMACGVSAPDRPAS